MEEENAIFETILHRFQVELEQDDDMQKSGVLNAIATIGSYEMARDFTPKLIDIATARFGKDGLIWIVKRNLLLEKKHSWPF